MFGKGLPRPTEEQARMIQLADNRNQVILGAAGSGKSVVAAYRALRLKARYTDKNIVVLTMNREIMEQIKKQIHDIDITVNTMYSYCQNLMYNYYHNRNVRFAAVTSKENKDAIDNAINEIRKSYPDETLWNKVNETNSFFINEITWMQENGISKDSRGREKYQTITRIGRGSERISSQQRDIMFEVYLKYYEKRATAYAPKIFSYNDIYSYILDLNIPDFVKPDFIIIDEVQDFAPIMFQALNKIVADDCRWYVLGDVSQNIFGQRLSWVSLGVENVRKSRLNKNYRNSYEIGMLAKQMLSTEYFDNKSNDFVETIPLPEYRSGKPKIKKFDGSFSDIVQLVKQKNVDRQSVAIITMNFNELKELKDSLNRNGIDVNDGITNYDGRTGVYLQTINKVKGLEFDTVIIFCLDSANYRDNADIVSYGTLDVERMETEDKAIVSKRIYVAVTRARRDLVMYYKNSKLDFLFTDDKLFDLE
ncbi:hypothetical protein E4T91_04685 [Ligilactobacillus murinus]|uniref:UvrD-helicase domain-containing protein n=1 Tax=Ligilactobacillus murinus TaxID=1622 RepID=UPI001071D79C|nr:UvrD-helicase domain-containing protein [Ligilactobacillus murinus]MBF0758045.1 AAA family ATPase [Ligilactobacillus murinus]MBF0832285.1 AAA family ATPase [Ligilactobacillus murinus]TFU64676.1 hypothetical protein E4T91_04685 [Ligilactobacillus murinus]